MDIKATLHSVLALYIGSRRIGHTTAAINGVQYTPDAVLLVADHGLVLPERRHLYRTNRVRDWDEVRGYTGPVVLDNSAVVELARASLKEIERLEADNERLRERSGQHFKHLQMAKMAVGHAEARYARALGELAWLRLPLWKKAVKYLRHADLRRWRREAAQ